MQSISQVLQGFNLSTTALSLLLERRYLPTSIRTNGVVYYEWRVCSAAFLKWIGLIVNDPWWFILAYTGINILLHSKTILKLCIASTLHHFYKPNSQEHKHKKQNIRRAIKTKSALIGLVAYSLTH